ncbi:MAG: FAD-dependent oxidoreductase [Alistipes sp.]|nr:FAD-dependent oxidoreductase [Alistipes sp.]
MKRIAVIALLSIATMAAAKPVEKRVQVLVVGGTTSGTSAGIASARNGATTLIVEETPWLGGMFTAQGVGAVDGNHAMPSGIWNEFRERLRSHYGGAEALATGWVSATLFEPQVGASIFASMAGEEPLLEVLHEYYLTGLKTRNGRIRYAMFEDGQGNRLKVTADIYIDATDLGDCLPLAGAEYRLGMDSRHDTGEDLAPEQANDVVQDLTWVAILKDYGPGADMTIPRPEGYDPAHFEGCHSDWSPAYMLDYGKMPNGKYMINWPRNGNDVYLNVVEMDRESRARELQKAKDFTLSFVYHIQTALGLSYLGLADDVFDTPDKLAYLPYHREGRRVKGLVTFTLDDVTDRYGRPNPLYRTGISVGDYPVDHHHGKRPDIGDIDFPSVPSFNVPLGSLIPERVDNLIVSDKAISVSNLINGSTRLQPIVFLTGQAAGTLAALSATGGKAPRTVPIREVQANLLRQGAYLMPLYDVQPGDEGFEAIQRVTATGIIRTTGEPYHWANRTWFYPDSTITVAEFSEGLNSYYPSVALSDDRTELTGGRAKTLIAAAGGTTDGMDIPEDRPVTRRELAQIVDRALDPFAIPVDHNGKILN